ncbi:MAG: polysaccharide biosynthesis C-terminal domain-containing protein [Cyclobacteriaceae bacterium]|nr:polysaccharide biosynthesis C-terminal domain-containing protein [Cyclobacteriaceae bacterium HetDA_MAG_MS6]
MKSLRLLASQTAIYGVSSVLGRVLNYFLVPLYTQVFLAGEYGVVTELYAYMAFLNIVFTYGMETAYFRFASKSKSEGNDFFNIAQLLITCTTLVFVVGLWLFSESIAEALQYPGQSYIIKWATLILGVDALVAIPFARWRLQGKALIFAFVKVGVIVITISLNIFFLVICPWWLENWPNTALVLNGYDPDLGVGYVFLSNLWANALLLLVFLPQFIELRPRVSVSRLREMLRYALPLLILGLAGVTNEMLSRALLKYWLPEGFYEGRTNLEALGVFGACYKLSVFMTLAVQAFRYAYEPFFFNKSESQDSQELFRRVMNAFVIFGCISWMIISTLLPELAPIFLRQKIYLSGLGIVPLLLGASLFLGIYYNLSVWYKLTDNTWYGAVISMFGATSTILFNYLLIPHFGYMGSAWAAFFTYLLMVVISYFWGGKHYPIPYNSGRILLYLISSGVIVSLTTTIDLAMITRYTVGFGGVAIFSFGAYIFERRDDRFASKA